MKTMKHSGKKVLSVFLAVLMVMTAWVFVAPTEAEAASKTVALSALAAISNGSGDRDNGSRIVICSDGEVGNTTVGNARFSMASIPENASKVTFNLSTGNHGGTLVSGASVKVFLIDPSKCQATSITHAVNNIANVYGSNYNAQQGVTNAYNYYGVTESQALYTFSQNSSSHSFDITNAVNTARANGWSDLCFAFIMPAIYNDGNGNSWSDTHINVSGTNLVCEYEPVGMYYIKYVVNVTDTGDEKDNNLFVSYRTNNGQGTLVENETLIDGTQYSWNGNNVTIYEGYINGFPTELWHHFAFDMNTRTERHENFRMYIGSGPDNLTSYSLLSTSGNNWTYKNSAQDNHMPVQSGYDPYQARISGMTSLSVTVDKNGQGQSLVTTGTVYDQYGVQWYQAPTYAVSSSSTSQVNVSGISAVASGRGAYVKVTDPSGVFKSEYGYNPSTGKVTLYLRATSGGVSASVPITITAPQYNAYLNYYSGANAKTYSNIGYYNQSVTLTDIPANTATAQIAGDDNYHQPYEWPANVSGPHTLTGDLTLKEVKGQNAAHSYGDWTQNENDHTRTCSVCGYVQTQEHKVDYDMGYITKEETCTEDGVMTYDCSVCGKKAIETSVINKITGHDFSGEIVENVTGENGNHWKKCSRCDVYGWGTTANNYENHNWDKNSDGVVDAGDAETKASTCKEAGYEKYTCKVCNATWTKTLDLAAHTITATAKKDVANICGGDGNAAFWSCSVCNRVWKDEALTEELADTTDADNDGIPDALETKGPAHDFTGACVSATGGKDGTHHRQCTRFTQCKTYGPEEKHTWGEPAVTAATCLKAGKKVYTCTSGCGQTYEETIEKADHQMTKIPAVTPECGKAGNNEYYYCSTCNKYYRDVNGTTETTVAVETLPALEHKWTAHHDYDTLKTAADCMNPAVYNNHCDYCKVQIIGATHPYGSPDTVNGHKFDGEIVDLKNGKHAYKCTVEGCTAYGNETKCKYEVIEDVDSTCHTFGYTTYKCTICGNGYSDTKALDPNNHTDEGTKIVGQLDAKCNTNGYTGDTHCLGCDALLEKGETIVADKTVHPHENMKDYEAKAPTCQTEGYKAYRYCDQCGTYEIAKETIAKKAHKFTTYTTNNNGTHTATCDTCDAAVATPATETGTCSGGTANCVDEAVCTVCKTAYGEVNSSNHKTRTFVAKVDSTCQVEGTEAYYKCTACNTNIDTPVTIEKKAHTYSSWTKVDGKDEHTRYCKTCVDDAANNLVIDRQTADCNGGTAYCNALAKCADCKAEYGELDLANHSTEANTLKDVVAATCQAPGYTGDYRYNCCNAIKVAGTATAQLAHTYDIEVEGSRIPATCIAEGSVKYKCSTCVESEGVTAATQKKELPIDAKNHASEETITVNAKAATCESDGHTGDVYYSCCYDSTKTEAENRKALKEKGTVIKANGQHVYGEAVPEYLIKEIKKVKDDEGNVISKEFDLKDVDALTYDDKVAARRDDDKWYHAQICTICYEVTYDACYTYAHTSNCVKTDTCEICKGLCSLKSPLVHPVELDYVAEKSATCTEYGVKAHYVCSVCGEKFFDALGKKPVSDDDLKISSAGGNHDYSPAEPIKGKDKHEYSCKRCPAKIEEDCSGGEATCKAKAKCSVCGQEYDEIDEKNHITDEVVIVGKKDATCSEGGYTGDSYYKCCYVDGAVDNSKAFKAMGEATPSEPSLHVIAYKDTDGDTHTAYCTACAYSVTVAHEWVEGETPELKNCTDTVEITSTCVCGKTKTKTIVGEHDLETKVDKKAATCISEGYEKTIESCKKCDYSATTNEKVLPKLPHNIVTEEAVKPTCDGVGKHAYTYCKNPGCPYGYKKDLFIGSLAGYEAYKNNDGKTVDKLGHQDKDNNGSCDNCYNPLKENIDGTRCNCICHKQNVFMKFLYKILQFFWKLFKIEQTCGCGTKHW